MTTTQTKPTIVAESPTPSAPAKGIGDENAQPPDNLPAPKVAAPEPGKAIDKAQKAHIQIVDGACKPDSFEGMYRIADLFWHAGLVPQGVNNPAQMMVALMAGSEIGLSPTQSIQNVMVINGRPTVWGDAALGLVRSSRVLEDIEETVSGEGDEMVATCRVKRKDSTTPTVRTFSVADAKAANLWGKGGPWKNYPKRMLQMRARGFALRDSCPDILKGLGIAEEIADIEVRGYQNRRTPGADSGMDAAADIASLPQQDPTPTSGTRAAAPGVASSSTGGSSASSPGAAPSPASNGAKNGRGKAVA